MDFLLNLSLTHLTHLVYLYLFIEDFVKKEKPMLYPSNLFKVKGMTNSTTKPPSHKSYL